MITFEMTHGRGDPKLSPEDQKLIQERLPVFFTYLDGKEHILKLRSVASDGCSRWMLNAKGMAPKFYVRITPGGGSYGEIISGREKAMRMAERVQKTGYGSICLIGSQTTPDEIKRNTQGIFVGSVSSPKWILVEILQWQGGTFTLPDSWACSQEATSAIAVQLAEVVQEQIHSLKPDRFDLGLRPEASEEQYQAACKKRYNLFMWDILNRSHIYNPRHTPNLFITEEEQGRMMKFGGRLIERWADRWERMTCLHGDLRGSNILVGRDKSPSLVLPIDYSARIQSGEPRFDDGRLIADLLEDYLRADSEGKTKIRNFIDTFIHTSQTFIDDKDYLEGLCLGIFSMTWIKLAPFGRPIKEPEIARVYLKNTLRILEKGHFCWP